MRGHFHGDVVTALWVGTVAALMFHGMRFVGAQLDKLGMPAVGNAIGGFFTFGGSSN